MLIGLVGKPSSGKSTFMKAATMMDVAIASYPFTTIKPNTGVGYVRVKCADRDLGVQCNPRVGYCKNGTRFVPVSVIDVAGLVPGAHEGKGLGNQFLNDLNQADVLIHVLDVSGTTNEKGEAAAGYDPANDVKFLENEIDMWYLSVIKKGWEKFSRQIQQSKANIEEALARQLSAFKVSEKMAKEAIDELKLDRERPATWSEEDMKNIAILLRRKTKPIIFACNKVDMPGADRNFLRLKEQFPDLMLIPCSADSEVALRQAADKGLIEYLPGEKDFGVNPGLSEQQNAALEFIRKGVLEKFGGTGVQEALDKAVFEFLKYIAIFPGGVSKLSDSKGNVLPDCFLLPPDSTALDFANKIHTDLGKHFLYAIDVRTKKRIGAEHLLKNRDVIEIVSAAK